MELLLRFALAIFVGLAASSCHWLKKKYVDMSTQDSFLSYFHWRDPYFRNSLLALVSTECSLAYAGLELDLDVSTLVGFATAGYASDSVFNRATEQQP